MGGRHRFAGRDLTVRPLLAAVVPVVAVAGMTVVALMGGGSPATSTARIEVPRFSGSQSAPAVTSATVSSALPEGVPAIMNISGSGSSAVQRIKDERAEAARRAEQERQARAARAAQAAREARAAEAREAAARERAALEARQRAAAQPPATPTPSPTPTRSAEPDKTRTPAPRVPRELLDALFGSRGN